MTHFGQSLKGVVSSQLWRSHPSQSTSPRLIWRAHVIPGCMGARGAPSSQSGVPGRMIVGRDIYPLDLTLTLGLRVYVEQVFDIAQGPYVAKRSDSFEHSGMHDFSAQISLLRLVPTYAGAGRLLLWSHLVA